MELVSVGRLLRARWKPLGVGLLVAAVIGAVVGGIFPPRSARAGRPTGEALTQVLVEPPTSIGATTTSPGDDTTIKLSVLLGALMGTTQMTDATAQQAGIQTADLAILGPRFDPVQVATYLPDGQFPQLAAAAASTAVYQPYVVRIAANYTVPVLTIGTYAPTVKGAISLAKATVATLVSAARTPTGSTTPSTSDVKVKQLGQVTSIAVPAPVKSHLIGAAAAVGVLCLWCVGLTLASGLRRRGRRTGLLAEAST